MPKALLSQDTFKQESNCRQGIYWILCTLISLSCISVMTKFKKLKEWIFELPLLRHRFPLLRRKTRVLPDLIPRCSNEPSLCNHSHLTPTGEASYHNEMPWSCWHRLRSRSWRPWKFSAICKGHNAKVVCSLH